MQIININFINFNTKYVKFININKNDKLYYHIYFNCKKEEIKNKYKIKEEDKVTKIKIIIDYQVKSFKELFRFCECIESINFKKFYRNNITDMSWMFYECSSLKELNLSNWDTKNVINMSYMFNVCSSLASLPDISKWDTSNVENMNCIFNKCSSLRFLPDISKWTTKNITTLIIK